MVADSLRRDKVMNVVTLIGRLTRDPELRYIANTGTPVATFTLAVDKELSKDKKQEMESKGQATADFINIVVWGRQAESCANYLAKGRLVAIQGRIQSRSWETENGRRYATEVVANQVQFLEWSKDNDIPDGFIEVDSESENIPF